MDNQEKKQINEYKIRMSGSACLSKPPKRTNLFVDVSIKRATITGDIDIRDNDDGTKDEIYKLKLTPETEIKILVENEILEVEKKKTQSQKLRAVIFEMYNQQHSGGDIEFEDFYVREMTTIIDSYIKKLL